MGRNLTNLYISSSFQFLTQVSGSELQNGLGDKITGSLDITSSKADTATSASFATNATSASFSVTSISASYAVTASYSETTAPIKTIYETVYAGENLTKTDPVYLSGSQGANPIAYKADAGNAAKSPAVYIMNETISSGATGQAIALGLIEGINLTGYDAGQEVYLGVGGGWTATRPTGSASVQILGIVTKGGAGGKGFVFNAGEATLPNLTAGYAWVGNANGVPVAVSTASFSTSVNTGSLMVTGSVNSNTLTFTKGDGSTFNLTVATGSATTVNTGSLLVTASSTNDTITYTKGDGSTFTNVINNVSASISASYATTASFASNIANGLSPSFANATASNVLITGTASIAFLNTTTISSSVIFTSGSNTLGDNATLDTQTLVGRVIATGSFEVTGSTGFSGTVTAQNGFTGSLSGTASFATSASQAVSASWAPSGNPFPFTGSAVITGSLLVTGSTQITTGTDPTTYTGNNNSLILASNAAVNKSTVNNIRSIVGGITMGSYLGGEAYGITGSQDSIIFGLEGQNFGALAVNSVTGSAIIANGNKVQVGSNLGYNGNTTYSAMIGASGGIMGGLQNCGLFASFNSFIYGSGNVGIGMAIVGGQNNTINRSQYSTIFGGTSNTIPNAFNDQNQIVGGSSNTITAGGNSGIYGGSSNAISTGNATILGGNSNTVSGGTYPQLIGSINSSITSGGSYVGLFGARGGAINGGDTVWMFGGQSNTITNGYISGLYSGRDNVINTGTSNALGGGNIWGGYQNQILGNGLGFSEILGGNQNVISGSSMSGSVIIGGFNNRIDNLNGVTVIGNNVTASEAYSVHLGRTIVSGSVRGEVKTLSISSNTASLDLSTSNFFTVQLVSGSNTYINPSNIQPGQTVNIRINTTGSGTVSFPSSVKQVSGSAYVPTTTTGVDVVTLISFDSSDLYLSNVKNLV